MIPRESRGLGYYASSHWFQWAVLLVLLGSIVIGLLWALDDAKERVERQSVALTVRNMNTGLRFAIAEALVQRRGREIESWAGRNPVTWLGAKPSGYFGECSKSKRMDFPVAAWCFDPESRELVYRPRKPEHLKAADDGNGGACSVLTWRVIKVPEKPQAGDFVSLSLKEASFCQWVVE